MVVSGNPLTWSREKAAGPDVGGAQYGALAPSQRSVQVLAAADLDQLRQGPGPPRSRITSMTWQEAIRKNSRARRSACFRAELVTEHPAQVTDNLGSAAARYRKIKSPRQQATR